MTDREQFIDQTRKTYDEITAAYLSANADRSFSDPLLDAFCALLPPGGRVLDIGCGPGFDSGRLAQRGFRPAGLDLSHAMATTARRRFGVAAARADMRRLPLGRCADGVWALASLLHVPRADTPGVLREWHRVLRHGGVVLLSLKEGVSEGWSEGAYGHALSRYFVYWQADVFDPLLAAAGFDIVQRWRTPAPQGAWLTRLLIKSGAIELA